MKPERSLMHAWVVPSELADPVWTALRHDAIGVLRAASARLEQGRAPDAPAVLRGPLGIGPPELNVERIAFNGNAFLGGSADPFSIERCASTGVIAKDGDRSIGRAVRRCDTLGQPYDLAVSAILLVTLRHLGDAMRLGSSGSLRGGWSDAAALVREVLRDRAQLSQSEAGVLRWLEPEPARVERRARSSA